jgi:hypothetical protein
MRVIHKLGVFALWGDYDRDAAKRAGWWWHARCPATCAACAQGLPLGRWWCDSEQQVVKLLVEVQLAGGDAGAVEFGDDMVEARVRAAAAPLLAEVVPAPQRPVAPEGQGRRRTYGRDFRRQASGDTQHDEDD